VNPSKEQLLLFILKLKVISGTRMTIGMFLGLSLDAASTQIFKATFPSIIRENLPQGLSLAWFSVITPLFYMRLFKDNSHLLLID